MPINDDGTFTRPNYSFNDTLKVYYQFASKKGGQLNNSAEVTFSSGALPALKHIYYNKATPVYMGMDTTGDYYNTMLAIQQAKLAELLKQTTLQNVTVTARKKSRLDTLDERYASNMFSGGVNVAAQFDFIKDPSASSATDVLHFLQGKVGGLIIVTNPPGVSWRGGPTSLFVNETQVLTANINDAVNVQDIAYIKVFRPPFFSGGSGGSPGGAIAIYTRKGGEDLQTQFAKGLPEKRIIGYTVSKEFYSPDYSIDSVMNIATDIRSTLYWNPWVLTTPGSHIARLIFYNNDIAKKIRVVIEGIDGDGRLTRIEKIVE
jgi:hypothetical protein